MYALTNLYKLYIYMIKYKVIISKLFDPVKKFIVFQIQTILDISINSIYFFLNDF